MTDQKTEQQFIDEVRSVFNRSVEQVDAETLSRLNIIRNIALDTAPVKSRPWIFYPAGAFVAACLAIIIFTFVQPESSPLKAEDIEMLSTSDSLDFFENLEFYQWLEDHEISV